jgi:hypothetical protein
VVEREDLGAFQLATLVVGWEGMKKEFGVEECGT